MNPFFDPQLSRIGLGIARAKADREAKRRALVDARLDRIEAALGLPPIDDTTLGVETGGA